MGLTHSYPLLAQKECWAALIPKLVPMGRLFHKQSGLSLSYTG